MTRYEPKLMPEEDQSDFFDEDWPDTRLIDDDCFDGDDEDDSQ